MASADEGPVAGEVLFCGATDFETIWSGERNEKQADILRPSRIGTLLGPPRHGPSHHRTAAALSLQPIWHTPRG